MHPVDYIGPNSTIHMVGESSVKHIQNEDGSKSIRFECELPLSAGLAISDISEGHSNHSHFRLIID